MGASLAFLNGPFGGKELLAKLDKLGDREFEFFTVLEVTRDGDFLANRAAVLSVNGSKIREHQQAHLSCLFHRSSPSGSLTETSKRPATVLPLPQGTLRSRP